MSIGIKFSIIIGWLDKIKVWLIIIIEVLGLIHAALQINSATIV